MRGQTGATHSGLRVFVQAGMLSSGSNPGSGVKIALPLDVIAAANSKIVAACKKTHDSQEAA